MKSETRKRKSFKKEQKQLPIFLHQCIFALYPKSRGGEMKKVVILALLLAWQSFAFYFDIGMGLGYSDTCSLCP